MKLIHIVLALVAALAVTPIWAGQPPAWFTKHVATMTAAGGTWRADNNMYRSEQEPATAYILVFSKGIGGHGMTGYMYSVSDDGVGEKRHPDIWQFRLYWDPHTDQAIALQFGANGAVGKGSMITSSEGTIRTEQVFYGPEGGTRLIGHVTQQKTPRESIIESYNIDDLGHWQANRHYRWIHQNTAAD